MPTKRRRFFASYAIRRSRNLESFGSSQSQPGETARFRVVGESSQPWSSERQLCLRRRRRAPHKEMLRSALLACTSTKLNGLRCERRGIDARRDICDRDVDKLCGRAGNEDHRQAKPHAASLRSGSVLSIARCDAAMSRRPGMRITRGLESSLEARASEQGYLRRASRLLRVLGCLGSRLPQQTRPPLLGKPGSAPTGDERPLPSTDYLCEDARNGHHGALHFSSSGLAARIE